MNDAIVELPTAMQRLDPADLSVAALANFHEGLAMMEAGLSREALLPLTRCLEQEPYFVAGHLCLGMAHAVSCNVYPAIDHLERATELAPDSFGAHYTLAKLYFTLRIPAKGYESAERALPCARTREERLALSELLQKERERERSGMARPLFNRNFGLGFGLVAASGLAAFIVAIALHIR